MSAGKTVSCIWREDGTASVYARVTARDGTGAATGVNGEGKFLKQADISSITCKVFDPHSATPTTPTQTYTLAISSVILDTPVTSRVVWTLDAYGYNFLHDLAPANFPTGGGTVRVEYKFTLTGGAVFFAVFEGTVAGVLSS